MDSEITKNYMFDHAGKRKISFLMSLAPDDIGIDNASENKIRYTHLVPNSSKNKREIVTSKIMKSLVKGIK